MDINEVRGLLSDAFTVGYMAAVRAYEPHKDVLKAKEVKDWLKMNFIDVSDFNRLVEAGEIATIKGNAPNSPHLYSRMQIRKALMLQSLSMADAREHLERMNVI